VVSLHQRFRILLLLLVLFVTRGGLVREGALMPPRVCIRDFISVLIIGLCAKFLQRDHLDKRFERAFDHLALPV
jgi:hypothetical protein